MTRQNHPARLATTRTALAAALLGIGASSTTAAAATEWAEGRILVAPRAGLPSAAFERILEAHGAAPARSIAGIGVHLVKVPAQAEAAVARALARHPHIDFAEPDMRLALNALTPNDPRFGNAWHLPKIAAPDAWDHSQGANVVIAILDTGVYAGHPDLASRMLPGYNAVDQGTDTTDINGHGTAVAGSAAATTDNGIGVAGVAGQARILPVRVSNDPAGYAYYSTIAQGLSWAADNGARVANISYDATPSGSIANAAQYLRSKGGVVVVAAGNSGGDPGHSDSPYMISVSASTSSDVRASWSSYGYYVDVAAPGAGIWTTNRDGGYGSWNGTSFASPVTAGVVALIQAADPTLGAAQVEALLTDTADDLGAAGWDSWYGHGRVNAGAAVAAALAGTTGDTLAPSASVANPLAGATVSGLVPVDVTAADNVAVVRVELYANGQLVAEDTSAPYAFSWDSTAAADGPALLQASAYDGAGNRGDSAEVTVLVDNLPEPVDAEAPVAQVLDPVDGASVSGNLQIRMSASDNVGVVQLSCYVDGQLLGVTSSDTLTCNWNTRKAADGTHTIEARAEDAAGNSASDLIQVTTGGTDSGAGGGGKGGGKRK